MTSDRDNGPSDAVQVSKTCETAAQNERRAKNSFLAGRYQPRIRVVRCAPGHCCRGKGWWRVHDGSMCGLSVANTAKHAFVTPNDRSSPSLPYTARRDDGRSIKGHTRQSVANTAKHAFVTPNGRSSPSLPYAARRDGYRRIKGHTRQSVANTAKHAFVTPNDRSSPSLPYTAWRDGYRRINRRTRQSAAHNAKHAFVTPNDQSSARGSHFTLQTQSNGARHLTHS
jgi:hypothetical protein